jgi:diguanylate cyclase (GGDEF)-like protein/PAS domain S-box-containing protein
LQTINGPIKILVVEDVATDVTLAIRELSRDGLKVNAKCVETRENFVHELQNFKPNLILSDYSLPKFDGLSALKIAHEEYPEIPFIFVSGTIGEERAISALKGGAVDYVLKSNLQRLASAVRRAMDEVQMRSARLQAESRFRDMIEFAPHAMVILNDRGLIEIVNRQVELLFGYNREEIIGAFTTVLIPERFQQWHQAVNDKDNAPAWLQQSPFGLEVCGRRKDGTEFPAEVNLSPLQTDAGLWISSVIRDISKRKAQENHIARLSRLHAVLSSINTAILRIHDRARFLEEACRIAVDGGQFAAATISIVDPVTSMMKPEAAVGIESDLSQWSDPYGREDVMDEGDIAKVAFRTRLGTVSNDLASDLQLTPWHAFYLSKGYRSAFVVPLLIAGKSIGILSLFASECGVFNDEEQRLLSVFAADISFALDRFEKEAHINYLAYFDSLTGLPNRSLFQDRLAQLITLEAASNNHNGNIAVVLVDLERFRSLNDTLGRSAGDELLREVASRMSDCVPDASYLARINADCFAFVVKDSRNGIEVVNLLERKLAIRLAEPILALKNEIRVAVKAGIALFPSNGADVDILLRNAEAALKNAKASKVRYLFYTAGMNARAAEKFSMENRLRKALDEEQFVLHYQPKVNLETGRIVGLEALLRWDEPGVGIVAPSKFIHLLEETGLIVDVGSWVIAQAHRQYQEWIARGIESPRIAVNVSQLQIRRSNFVSHVLQILDGARPEEIEIEITESLFMEDFDDNFAKLSALREAGITVAIDDFGTGYSSLSYIGKLPIDTLKIDRSFIVDMAVNADNRAIVSTIISLAHSLNFKVVAEGVETSQQSDLLKLLKCDQIQGFIYSPALPPEQIEAKLRRQAGLP